jgi:hypothetical protein
MKLTHSRIALALSLTVVACSATIGGKAGGPAGSGGSGGGAGSGGGSGSGGGNNPVVASFTATPAMLPDGGGMVTLSWSVTNADQIIIDQGVGPVTGSSTTTTITATTIFTLSASNKSGTTTKSALVSVGAAAAAPVILSFTATPASLSAAGQSMLTWQVQNADTISIDHGVGTVTGTSASVNVSATTIYTMTATNANGMTTATTAVVIGQNPSTRPDGHYVYMVAPVGGESFIAPATLRLVAAAHDPGIDTNYPVGGQGGNAQKVQFFVDDTVVFEQNGSDAEYWVFKGFVNGITTGQHRVWARGIYPDDVLDSPPMIITVSDPPTYAMTVDLTADITVGSSGYSLVGTADQRIRLNGNGFKIVAPKEITGAFTMKFVDVFDLGDRTDTSKLAIDVATSGVMTIEDCNFDTSNTLNIGADSNASIQRNLLRSNMRMPIGQFPDNSVGEKPSFPVATLAGSGAGTKIVAGNNVGASWFTVDGKGWTVGGDTDADTNILIGPRVGLYVSGDTQLRRNYSHHIYYGGWSQGSNFGLGASANVVAEHNVIYGSSWPVRGVAGEVRYNLILDAGHQWLWADNQGASVHHNVMVGGDNDVAGIYILYDHPNINIYNNTLDLQNGGTFAVQITMGTAGFSSNLILNLKGTDVSVMGGTLTADYNFFASTTTPYSDGRKPAHDIFSKDPMMTSPPTVIFDLDEVGVWKRTITVRDILMHYRTAYTPKAGSPAIDAGDPAYGSGNDIGAVGGGAVNANDKFGQL